MRKCINRITKLPSKSQDDLDLTAFNKYLISTGLISICLYPT